MKQQRQGTPGPRDERFWVVMDSAVLDADEAAGSTLALVRRRVQEKAREGLERAVRVQKNVRGYINAVDRLLALNYDDGTLVESQELEWVLGEISHVHRSSQLMLAGLRRDLRRGNKLLEGMDAELENQMRRFDALIDDLKASHLGTGARRSTTMLRIIAKGCANDPDQAAAPPDDWNSPQPTLSFDENERVIEE